MAFKRRVRDGERATEKEARPTGRGRLKVEHTTMPPVFISWKSPAEERAKSLLFPIHVWPFLGLDHSIPATLSLNSFYFISTDPWKRPRKSKIDLGPAGGSRIDSPTGPDFSTTEAKTYSFKSKSKSGRLRWSLFYSCSRDMGIE
ncbi:hypothetical protein KY290_025746 [Solanum tuberosum]|uniref:Uncharacterized protein n=1 Tax=Solanum tuberosum TaxID=4113 RepID=A0ABQ7UUG2_SOLTU|nr:hypothetical protein KY289_024806 [Solanum tuberosum]KAH0676769.1 hypothetical protein KY285_024570 [Solanum tuberosum]KAH0755476.1 hypothetical protein KY290_025746 [Solanum tuberosum]